MASNQDSTPPFTNCSKILRSASKRWRNLVVTATRCCWCSAVSSLGTHPAQTLWYPNSSCTTAYVDSSNVQEYRNLCYCESLIVPDNDIRLMDLFFCEGFFLVSTSTFVRYTCEFAPDGPSPMQLSLGFGACSVLRHTRRRVSAGLTRLNQRKLTTLRCLSMLHSWSGTSIRLTFSPYSTGWVVMDTLSTSRQVQSWWRQAHPVFAGTCQSNQLLFILIYPRNLFYFVHPTSWLLYLSVQ